MKLTNMKNEQRLLYKLMSNFEGMQKIEVFDLLHRIEILLYYTKSPINNTEIRQIITSNIGLENGIDPFVFTILPNGNFCELEGSNDWIHIYKEVKRGFTAWNPFTTYYFKTKYVPLELLKLTKKNLLENVENTPIGSEIEEFLKTNRITKKDPQGSIFLLSI